MIGECAGWLARLAFAAVFASAAFGKLTGRAQARAAVAGFGVPQPWVPPVAWALPSVEAVVAAGVLVSQTASSAAAGGVLLLAAFSVVVAVHLARGHRPVCACFGTLSAEPVGPWTLVRNGLLIAVGAGAWWAGAALPRPPAGPSVALAVGVGLGAVQLWQGLVLRELRRQPAPPLAAPVGLPVGALAPEFDLPASAETPSTLAGLLATGRGQILVFLHPECAPCRMIAGELPVWAAKPDAAYQITVIGTGTLPDNRLWEEQYGITRYLVQRGNEVAARYLVRGTPYAVPVDADGRIAGPVAAGPVQIRELLAATR
ncbi:putative membrane protein YphA (DoxX/SURF4 family) [Kitasatospora sp. MAA4]|uniref:MauE/DoxX family redox-associated membrane protein n=1 Tax=Kitasatospora sp. MAA4 TaxID=3035093 RepID=UPI002475B391|nr:MauE/DoxX family redox-associated membrane protein [Kitasatospora sp. MAA4]MDH6135192.1 putative membrane protein YphA (DoxX/SURF4 family) [Kitasatospora sp. MAA4]